MGFEIRMAAVEDAARLLEIYAPYVEETTISFEYETPSLEEFAGRIQKIFKDYPYLVCQKDGEILGYAYAHRFGERAAYQWGAELSIYIDRNCLHMGLGKAMYTALIDILRMQNVCTVYGCVTCPNPPSERFHQSMGFRRLEPFHAAGYKMGAWLDVVWFEKSISDTEGAPQPLLSFSHVDKLVVDGILKKCAEMIPSC